MTFIAQHSVTMGFCIIQPTISPRNTRTNVTVINVNTVLLRSLLTSCKIPVFLNDLLLSSKRFIFI